MVALGVKASEATRVRELTPRGSGGLSVIAVEGRDALARVRALVPSLERPSGAPRVVRLACGGDALDEAIVLARNEREIELHVHGSPALVRRLLDLLGAEAPAAAMELEARALAQLAHAPCEAAARILLDQAEGALRRAFENLLDADERTARARLDGCMASARVASFALEPRTVVLAGPVNAGKSTLFNALFGGRRVIVSAEPGTTRDVIAERVQFGAWPVDLLDTAGERDLAPGPLELAREVERAGQTLARELRARADLVLWLRPCDARTPSPPVDERTRVVSTHADRCDRGDGTTPRISALHAPDEAVRAIHALYQAFFELPREPWTAGEPVAFDAASRATLERARAALCTGADWRAPLELALARDS